MPIYRILDCDVILDEEDYRFVSRFQFRRSGEYIYVAIDPKRCISLHRFIFGYADLRLKVDHINGNTLDNRKENLRLATTSQNAQNVKRTPAANYLGVKDVGYSYQYCITSNNKSYYVRGFDSELGAAVARDEACKYLHGEFAVLNFPEMLTTATPPEKHLNQIKSSSGTRKDQALMRMRNARKSSDLVKFGVKVDKRNGNFIASIPTTCGVKSLYIGTFKQEQEAREAYDSVSKYYYGDQGALNFPDSNIKPEPVEYWRKKCKLAASGRKYVGTGSVGNKFDCTVNIKNRTINLGTFDSEDESALIRDMAYLYVNPGCMRLKLNIPDHHTVACDPSILRKAFVKNGAYGTIN